MENIRTLNKLIKEKNKTEITRYKGEYWILHICINNVPVPLFHSKNLKDIKEEIKIRGY